MRTCLVLLVALSFSAGASPTWSRAADKDAEGLQGTWVVAAAEAGGEKVPEEVTKEMSFAFKGDKVVVSRKGRAESEETFTLDAGKKPKTIDVTPKSKGIYELDGDSLTIRFFKDGSGRPTAIAGATKAGEVLLTLKRKKP